MLERLRCMLTPRSWHLYLCWSSRNWPSRLEVGFLYRHTNVPTERMLEFPAVYFLYFLGLELRLERNWSRIPSCEKWTSRYLVLHSSSCTLV